MADYLGEARVIIEQLSDGLTELSDPGPLPQVVNTFVRADFEATFHACVKFLSFVRRRRAVRIDIETMTTTAVSAEVEQRRLATYQALAQRLSELLSQTCRPRLPGSPSSAGNKRSPVSSKAAVGQANKNNQELVRVTSMRSSSHTHARIWVLRCQKCGYSYGANGCDFWMRKCPNCMEGAPGEELPDVSRDRC